MAPKSKTNELEQYKQQLDSQARLIKELQIKVTALEQKTSALEDKVTALEQKTSALEEDQSLFLKDTRCLKEKSVVLESHILLSQHVSSLLKRDMDDTNQYSRRQCLILTGITPSEDSENELETKARVQEALKNENLGEASNDVDRAHPVGPRKDGKQSIIVKFRSFHRRTEVYTNRKSCKKFTYHLQKEDKIS